MGMEMYFVYNSSKISLKVEGKDIPIKELKSLIDSVRRLETGQEARQSVLIKQLKEEIDKDADVEEFMLNGYWDIPADFLKNKELNNFFLRESDLNQSIHYEKNSFMLNVSVSNEGQQLILNRNELNNAISQLQIQEKLKRTRSALIRIKGAIKGSLKQEIEDYLQKTLPIEHMKVHFQNKDYGDRASLEIILFGDFPTEQ